MSAVREKGAEVLFSGVTGFDKEIDICVVPGKAVMPFQTITKLKCEKHWRGSFPDTACLRFCLSGRPRT